MLPMKTGLPARALRIVPCLTPEEVQQLCAACRGRRRDRDALLILVLFQTGLRISEALSRASFKRSHFWYCNGLLAVNARK